MHPLGKPSKCNNPSSRSAETDPFLLPSCTSLSASGQISPLFWGRQTSLNSSFWNLRGSPTVTCLPEETHYGQCSSRRNMGAELKARSHHSWGPLIGSCNSMSPIGQHKARKITLERQIFTTFKSDTQPGHLHSWNPLATRKTVSLSSELSAGCTCSFLHWLSRSLHSSSGNIKVLNALSRSCKQLPPLLHLLSGLAVDGNAHR